MKCGKTDFNEDVITAVVLNRSLKNFILPTGFRVSAAVLYQLSYEDHILGAGKFVELILTRERNNAWNGDDELRGKIHCFLFFKV